MVRGYGTELNAASADGLKARLLWFAKVDDEILGGHVEANREDARPNATAHTQRSLRKRRIAVRPRGGRPTRSYQRAQQRQVYLSAGLDRDAPRAGRFPAFIGENVQQVPGQSGQSERREGRHRQERERRHA
jgi:hypothetical protein